MAPPLSRRDVWAGTWRCVSGLPRRAPPARGLAGLPGPELPVVVRPHPGDHPLPAPRWVGAVHFRDRGSYVAQGDFLKSDLAGRTLPSRWRLRNQPLGRCLGFMFLDMKPSRPIFGSRTRDGQRGQADAERKVRMKCLRIRRVERRRAVAPTTARSSPPGMGVVSTPRITGTSAGRLASNSVARS